MKNDILIITRLKFDRSYDIIIAHGYKVHTPERNVKIAWRLRSKHAASVIACHACDNMNLMKHYLAQYKGVCNIALPFYAMRIGRVGRAK